MGKHKRPPDVARSQYKIRYEKNILIIIPYRIQGILNLHAKTHIKKFPTFGVSLAK